MASSSRARNVSQRGWAVAARSSMEDSHVDVGYRAGPGTLQRNVTSHHIHGAQLARAFLSSKLDRFG